MRSDSNPDFLSLAEHGRSHSTGGLQRGVTPGIVKAVTPRRVADGSSGGVTKSPFFRPSAPKPILQPVSTPNGTIRRFLKKAPKTTETKSTLCGTYANLVNAVVGAGIVGMPYAVKQTGLVAGILMIALCAVLTEKSLRLLIETGKHLDVPSYETLMEASFGMAGFYFISINMFIMAFGGMVCYLLIIKDTVPVLFGVLSEGGRRLVLTACSSAFILPLSLQRDMADLSKTSSISVTFDIVMVTLIAIYAPIPTSMQDSGGFAQVLSHSTFEPSTFFIGLGVLSFAFVCQDASFIIAGSLEKPTKTRWAKVTKGALSTCAILATICGVSGFLAFQQSTNGNILNNFNDPNTARAANVARGLLGSTMFFVYPLASYVARHVCVVTLFRGRRAHEGDDHSVLARSDRRIVMTVALYVAALMPALLFDNLGTVLAATGAIGGSCLSYIGPGLAYLGVHGGEFLLLVERRWRPFVYLRRCLWKFPQSDDGSSKTTTQEEKRPLMASNSNVGMALDEEEEVHNNETALGTTTKTNISTEGGGESSGGYVASCFCIFTWYALQMPLWCAIAAMGERNVPAYKEQEALKSPCPKRLGKVIQHSNQQQQQQHHRQLQPPRLDTNATAAVGLQQTMPSFKVSSPHCYLPHVSSDTGLHNNSRLMIGPKKKPLNAPPTYGSAATTTTTNDPKNLNNLDNNDEEEEEAEEDPQKLFPTWFDFMLAMAYMVLGVVAASAGLVSIYMS